MYCGIEQKLLLQKESLRNQWFFFCIGKAGEVVSIKENRLIICRDLRHAADECRELASKLHVSFIKSRLVIDTGDVSVKFLSVAQLSNGGVDGCKFTNVQVLEGAYESRFINQYTIDVIEQLKADAKIWKEDGAKK